MEKKLNRTKSEWLCCLVAVMLLLSGCAGNGTKPESGAEPPSEPAMVLRKATPAPTATPGMDTVTPEPDMTFEDDGDIYFSETYKANFITKVFAFDRAPRVLIYHTHAREAFREETGAAGTNPQATDGVPGASPAPEAGGSTRSTDQGKNVVRVGDVLAQTLEARGFVVIHDKTDVEEPALATAYVRSREVLQRYEDIDVYIDLHRNAASADRAKNDVVMLAGKRVARLFFVVGTGLKADTDAGELPGWKQNYILALSLYERLRAVDPGLVKENRMKQGIYNQDLGLSLLCEIGHNANLLSDAENAVPYLADALAAVIRF